MKKELLALALLATAAPLFPQTPKGASPFNSPANQSHGQTRAVVIGISDYQDDAIPDLRFADRDAEALANFLRSPAGGSLDNDHLQVLTNQNATAGRVAEALDNLIERAKEGDEVIIYFSGHGDVEGKKLSQPGFLLCWDSPSRVYMGGGTYSLAYLQEVVSTLSVQNKARVVVVTDACHAGKLAGSQIGGAQLTAANLAKQFSNEVKILSCQPGELSLEGEQWGGGRGIFSYHLVDGLFGLADKNGDGSVSLGELDRYLEDKVTAEAAPQSQVPMLLGNKTERLATVNPAILTDLKKSRSGGLPVFMTTEGRGLEEEVLTKVDSNVRRMYFALKKAIAEKRFFEPEIDCAEKLYVQLAENQQLVPLRGLMKRNYAAALQDDAQQVLNTMLKTGLTEEVRSATGTVRLYGHYPRYLDRAAELLGKGHYMYAPLQARKHFFEGKLASTAVAKRQAYRQALRWQPDMPHALAEMISTYQAEQLDSARLFFDRAVAQAPAWVTPHILLAEFFAEKSGRPDKAEEMLNRAGQVDSSSVYVWYRKAQFYKDQKRPVEAEQWFRKAITGAGADICFPCAYGNLGNLYLAARRYDEAETAFKKAIELDSSFRRGYNGLGATYCDGLRRYDEAEACFKKAIQLDSTDAAPYSNLGNVYRHTRRYVEAEALFKKAIQLDSTHAGAFNNLGIVYLNTRRYEEAEVVLKKAVRYDPEFAFAYANLGFAYRNLKRYEEAEAAYKKALQFDSAYVSAYFNLGNVCTSTRRYDEAEAYFKKAIRLDPTYALAPYNLACMYSLQNRPDEAFEALEGALKAGYNKYDAMQKDTDLAPLREHADQWKALMKKHFPDKVKD